MIRRETFEIRSSDEYPVVRGKYLVLAFDWVGGNECKPTPPEWAIRAWDGKDWSRTKRTFDTGGYENFVLVAWCCLPANHAWSI